MMPKEIKRSPSQRRRVGYWQSSNMKKRQVQNGKVWSLGHFADFRLRPTLTPSTEQLRCAPVAPDDIQYQGFTHLNYAFGAINPVTFRMVDDKTKSSLYREFTNLKYKANGPQTWIAVGGFDFSDPGGSPEAESDEGAASNTHTTWYAGGPHL